MCPICKDDLEVSMITKMKNFYHISNDKELDDSLLGSSIEEEEESSEEEEEESSEEEEETLFNRRLKKLAASMNNINPRIKKGTNKQKSINKNRGENIGRTKKSRSLENIDDDLIRDIDNYRNSIKNEIDDF